MKVTKIPGLGRFGIFIDDVDFNEMTDDLWNEIGELHLQNLVTIIRDSNLNFNQQPEWLVKWGNADSSVLYRNLLKKYSPLSWGEIIQKGLDNDPLIDEVDIMRIKAIRYIRQETHTGAVLQRVTGKKDEQGNPLGMFAEGELLWHSNESGNLVFQPGVGLLAAECVVGSSTGFITTPDYYENVSNAFRSELDEMIILHRFTPGRINPGLRMDQDEIMHANMCPTDDVEIPLVIRSPGGITGLHYSVNTVYSIKGMSKQESDKVFETINKELFVDKYIYDHWYKQEGDFCLFDNSITLHRRLGDIKNRVCYRVQHDYNKLVKEKWQPYFQEKYAQQYNAETKHLD